MPKRVPFSWRELAVTLGLFGLVALELWVTALICTDVLSGVGR